jgi:hypothetical protein
MKDDISNKELIKAILYAAAGTIVFVALIFLAVLTILNNIKQQ